MISEVAELVDEEEAEVGKIIMKVLIIKEVQEGSRTFLVIIQVMHTSQITGRVK